MSEEKTIKDKLEELKSMVTKLHEGISCMKQCSHLSTYEKVFDALEWIAAMCSHVPNKGEQMVRYYSFYSNVSRGKRKKQDQDELIPSILQPVKDPDFRGSGSSKQQRKNWARLMQKIYPVKSLKGAA